MYRYFFINSLIYLFVFAILSSATLPAFAEQSEVRIQHLSYAAEKLVGFRKLNNKKINLNFGNNIPKSLTYENSILENGSGVCIGDIDNDGYPDIYLCKIKGENKLFKNLGNWKFKDITRTSGLAFPRDFSMGCVFLDSDKDKDLDILVSSLGNGVTLMINDGHGKYTACKNSGFLRKYSTHTFAVADIDLDGDLDVYCTNYNTSTIKDNPQTKFNVKLIDQTPKITGIDNKNITGTELEDRFLINELGQISELGEPDILYINMGNNVFQPIQVGRDYFKYKDENLNKETYYDWGLSVMFGDLNSDGYPDLYVCNDFKTPDRIWINNKNNTFTGFNPMNLNKTSYYSMGVDFSDINLDGLLDIFVLDMLLPNLKNRQTQIGANYRNSGWVDFFDNQYSHNTFLVNYGNTHYYDISFSSNTHATDWSWCPMFLDINLDGHEDLIVTNGHMRKAMDTDILLKIEQQRSNRKISKSQYKRLKSTFVEHYALNRILINNKDLTYTDQSKSMGFNELSISHGMASADLDKDGDQDIVINNANSLCSIYENISDVPRIIINLKGIKNNFFGIGCKVIYHTSNSKYLKEVTCGGRYLSGSDTTVTFPYFGSGKEDYIQISWPNGIKQILNDIRPNKSYEISEFSRFNDKPTLNLDKSTLNYTLRSKINLDIKAKIRDNNNSSKPILQVFNNSRIFTTLNNEKYLPGDDLETISIPNPYSDFENLIMFNSAISSPKKYLMHFLQNGDHLSLIFEIIQKDGIIRKSVILKNHTKNTNITLIDKLHGGVENINIFDFDGDGDLDLFLIDRYSKSDLISDYTKPYLFINTNGTFINSNDTLNVIDLSKTIQYAIWSDMDNNGLQDLILAENFGTIKIYLNLSGKLKFHQGISQLNEICGVWSCLEVADLNADGLLDILAGNIGNNNLITFSKDTVTKVVLNNYDENNIHVPFTFIKRLEDDHYRPLDNYFYYLKNTNNFKQRFPNVNSFANANYHDLAIFFKDASKNKFINQSNSFLLFNNGNNFTIATFDNEIQTGAINNFVLDNYTDDQYQDILIDLNMYNLDNTWLKKTNFHKCLSLINTEGSYKFFNVRNSLNSIVNSGDYIYYADIYNNGKIEVLSLKQLSELSIYERQINFKFLNIDVSIGDGNPIGVGTKIQLISNGKKSALKEIRLSGNDDFIPGSMLNFILPNGFKPNALRIQEPGGQFNEIKIAPYIGNNLFIKNGRLKP
jgi:hypothetical protein